MVNKKILFLGKKNDNNVNAALIHLKSLFQNVSYYLGSWGDDLPEKALSWKGDIIISFLSRWIIPQNLLDNARDLSINFHPATPDYPGVGCVNFALYDEVKEYGTTCHHMDRKVDVGDIIKVKRFNVYPSDNVESLLLRTYYHQLILFYEIIDQLYLELPLPKSTEKWARKPFTRNELNQLATLKIDMDRQDIKKRIRATLFKDFKPELIHHDFVFELKQTIKK